MIIDKNKNYLFLNDNEFRLGKYLLYDDITFINGCSQYIESLDKVNSDYVSIETEYDVFNYYPRDIIKYRDLLFGSIVEDEVSTLYDMDEIYLPFRNLNEDKKSYVIKDHMYLESYNYSTSFPELVNKYKLPKHFLLKALSTGCPDDEWPEAKKWNQDLQEIIQAANVNTQEEFKVLILSLYSKKYLGLLKNKVNIDDLFISLMTVYLNNSFELLTHTTIRLHIDDQKIFSDVIQFIMKYDLNKFVNNNIYEDKVRSHITINSSMLYDLFVKEYNNFSFLFGLSRKKSLKVYSALRKCLESNSLIVKDRLSALYIQEFFYRYKLLVSIQEVSSNEYILVQINDYKTIEDGFLIPVIKVRKHDNVNRFNNLINVKLK